MPAYNEEENIGNVVKECFNFLEKNGLKGEIIVANDGSTDQTGKILNDLKITIPNLKTVDKVVNSGYGSAMSDAIKNSEGDYVITIDSDGQFNIHESLPLLEMMQKGYDIVTSYRKKKMDTFLKVLSNHILHLEFHLLFGLRFKDPNSALKIYRGDLLKSITIDSKGYSFPLEMLVKFSTKELKLGEIPVSHSYRKGGHSSLHLLKTIINFQLFLFFLKFKQILFKVGIIREL